ncbi:peptide chain release factor N(5)-glutamine methyltransferase [Chthonobacter rhizosphaerae]|uniref:peptide chain release factor N(5)-glutamine methyltransferase n=1 Tax=Chthonobacter rhizosphaerae TaxID=2735553 RepID=UPI0015EFBAEE
MPTVDALLADARRRLRDAGLPTAALDARVLVAHALGWSAVRLVADGGAPTDTETAARIDELVRRRVAGEPVGRILGAREFHGLTFELGPDTLEPRPDTEVLVDAALALVRSGGCPGAAPDGEGLLFVDVGTGTGAIAVALLVALPGARGIAVDLAPGALAVAGANAARHGVAGRLDLREGSFLDPVAEPVPLIVANPPYIASAEIAGLAPDVRDHDPRLALDGGPDGLDAYRALSAQGFAALTAGGTICLEIGSTQAASVSALLGAAGFEAIRILEDLEGRDRVVVARKSARGTP